MSIAHRYRLLRFAHPLFSKLPSLSDEDMVNELRSRMVSFKSPTPSVEALLHAHLPHKFVDHSHAGSGLSCVY